MAVTIAYRVLPPSTPRWRSILPPAVLVGIAITLLTQLFTALVPFLVGAAAIAGSLASAFVALAWLSFSFQALLYGASWVRVAELRAAADPGQAAATLTAPPQGWVWAVPQRRQKRAVDDSESPQLMHGCAAAGIC